VLSTDYGGYCTGPSVTDSDIFSKSDEMNPILNVKDIVSTLSLGCSGVGITGQVAWN